MVMICWLQRRWRNEEVFNGVRLDLQQRLKHVVDCFVEDGVVQKAKKLQEVGLRRVIRSE